MPRNGSGVYSAPPNTLAVTLTTVKSPEYNAFVNDLVSDANAARPIVAGGTGATSASQARDLLGLEIGSDILGITYAPAGFLYGLTLSNNAVDTTNDIDVAVGSAASEATTPVLLPLASALTKRLDANWAPGTNNGMRYSGAAITDTTYHIYLAGTATGGSADIYADPSANVATVLSHLQAESGGSTYTNVRRIGSIIRESGAIVAFRQIGDYFSRASVTNRSSTAAAASTLLAISIPSGIIVQPIVELLCVMGTAGNIQTLIGNAGGAVSPVLGVASAGQMSVNFLVGGIYSNTASQIQFAVAIVSGTLTTNTLTTRGWIDARGRV